MIGSTAPTPVSPKTYNKSEIKTLKSFSNLKSFKQQKSTYQLAIDPKDIDTKTELKLLLEKVKLLNQIDSHISPRLNKKHSLQKFQNIAKKAEKVKKSRDSIIKLVAALQLTERLPLWKFKAKGVINPDRTYVLKGRKIYILFILYSYFLSPN